jgi:hypothetical protein
LRISSTSGSLPSYFSFWEVPCCPWRNVRSSRSSSCFSIMRAVVVFGSPVISSSLCWLVLGGWFLIFSSKTILLLSVTSS